MAGPLPAQRLDAFALAFEPGLTRLLGLDLQELAWISAVVLAVAFGAAPVRYDARTKELGDGDALLLVTDGVTKAIEADGPVEERLAGTVAHRRASGLQAVCERLTRPAVSARGPVGAGEWADDRTIVAVTLDEP